MSKHKFIEYAWQRYRNLVVPKNAGLVQLKETQQAFYAGACTLYEGLMQASAEADHNQGTDLQFMEGVRSELTTFGTQFDQRFISGTRH